MRTARSRSSGGYLFWAGCLVVMLDPHFQGTEPPLNPGRFSDEHAHRHGPRRFGDGALGPEAPAWRGWCATPTQAASTSIRYGERLAEIGAVPSIGSIGDSYDNALAETTNGLYKTELIRRRGPWRGVDEVELPTLEWVHWFNIRRLHGVLEDVPPAEFEAAWHEANERATLRSPESPSRQMLSRRRPCTRIRCADPCAAGLRA